MTSITQSTAGDGANGMGGGAISDEIIDSQLEIRELAETHEQDYLVFGGGVITDEINRSMGDSLAIVGPLAMLFVVVALLVAYRDPLDIVPGSPASSPSLVWTFGFMGWADIAFNQMFVAVPVLLIGLSIDYAIHVFMRHREQRETQRVSDQQTGSEATREQREADGSGGTVRGSMTIALGGVGAALVWVTATTVIGFFLESRESDRPHPRVRSRQLRRYRRRADRLRRADSGRQDRDRRVPRVPRFRPPKAGIRDRRRPFQ